ncbi:hypothetical protein JMJ35_005730 [Cladonia borealis]|uniref:Conidiation-specific protein 6 n=1 Tax=Cladonia borealis TaxID=184061 RepID=A0AA39R167_9LECA|nr:hypothetical protein JMJ35_005730 [Cladonia borealis]
MPDLINIAAGHKANLSNPKTSEESKQQSKEILERGFDGARWGKDEMKNPANVVAGHKAYLNNPGHPDPSVHSDEADQHSKEIVEQTEGKDPNAVAGGLKAAVNNPNVSEEAKINAEERLHELGQ